MAREQTKRNNAIRWTNDEKALLVDDDNNSFSAGNLHAQNSSVSIAKFEHVIADWITEGWQVGVIGLVFLRVGDFSMSARILKGVFG